VTNTTVGQCSAIVTYPACYGQQWMRDSYNCLRAGFRIDFPAGLSIVTCTATDTNGISGSCNFTVTVQETRLLVVSCPADIVNRYGCGSLLEEQRCFHRDVLRQLRGVTIRVRASERFDVCEGHQHGQLHCDRCFRKHCQL
jgi:hypothetical protein